MPVQNEVELSPHLPNHCRIPFLPISHPVKMALAARKAGWALCQTNLSWSPGSVTFYYVTLNTFENSSKPGSSFVKWGWWWYLCHKGKWLFRFNEIMPIAFNPVPDSCKFSVNIIHNYHYLISWFCKFLFKCSWINKVWVDMGTCCNYLLLFYSGMFSF